MSHRQPHAIPVRTAPMSPPFHISPKSPNLNPFSPLSPDLVENKLHQGDIDPEMNQILGLEPPRRPVTFYSRQQLLKISQSGHHARPAGMGAMDTWYGISSKPSTQYLEDPAIASISPPSNSNSRRGGYGEGFGFGGGIGGRGLGRGGRNIGLRRQPDTLDTSGLPVENKPFGSGQMGRFSVRNQPIRAEGSKKKEEEWRRSNQAPPRNRPTWQPREDDSSEPAWMDDVTGPSDVAVANEANDHLIKFIPGEDMIAAHKRAMKARDTRGDWRGDVTPSFPADPAIASSSHAARPKTFKAADYLTQTHVVTEEDQPSEATSAFTSRFQRFFGAPSDPEPQVAAHVTEEPRDDRMARLMGVLSSKAPEQRHVSSPPVQPHPPPFFDAPPHPSALLQQLYGGPRDLPARSAVDHDQRAMQHFSTPPMPQMYGQAYHPRPEYSNLPPPGFHPTPPYYGQPAPPPPPPQHFNPQPQYPPHIGAAQQDMLATLFAGLGPRS